MEIKVGRSENGDETRVVIEGVLDAVTVSDVRKSFDALEIRRPSRLVVDLSRLRLIDSCGVGAIVALYKRARAAGTHFAMVGANQQPLAVLRLLKLDKVFANDTDAPFGVPVALPTARRAAVSAA